MECRQIRKESDANMGLITGFSVFERVHVRLPRLKALRASSISIALYALILDHDWHHVRR
jgi:hypothetical protein